MQTGKIIGISVASGLVLIGGVIAYNYFTPPKFTLGSPSVTKNPDTLKVPYTFGKANRQFELSKNSSDVQQKSKGRSVLNFGWELSVDKVEKDIVFTLTKNGLKPKQLEKLPLF